MTTPTKNCPCGSNISFARCCEPLLNGTDKAHSAEQLMRSRYSAFYKREVNYIATTCWPQICHADELEALQQSVESSQWYGLKILSKAEGGPAHTEGTVEFCATYCTQDAPTNPQQLREKSSFIKRAGVWYYCEGNAFTQPLKQGRNETCWCDSGKKFKRCHGG